MSKDRSRMFIPTLPAVRFVVLYEHARSWRQVCRSISRHDEVELLQLSAQGEALLSDELIAALLSIDSSASAAGLVCRLSGLAQPGEAARRWRERGARVVHLAASHEILGEQRLAGFVTAIGTPTMHLSDRRIADDFEGSMASLEGFLGVAYRPKGARIGSGDLSVGSVVVQ